MREVDKSNSKTSSGSLQQWRTQYRIDIALFLLVPSSSTVIESGMEFRYWYRSHLTTGVRKQILREIYVCVPRSGCLLQYKYNSRCNVRIIMVLQLFRSLRLQLAWGVWRTRLASLDETLLRELRVYDELQWVCHVEKSTILVERAGRYCIRLVSLFTIQYLL